MPKMDILIVDLVFFTIFEDVEYYVARLFDTVNLISMSIAKDGYPNRRSCFLQSLTPLDVEYHVTRLIEIPQCTLNSNRYRYNKQKCLMEF